MSKVDAYLKQIIGLSAELNSRDEFIRRHGRVFTITEHSYHGPRGKRGQCYKNAGLAAMADPDLVYVEGFILFLGVLLEHAWASTPDGDVRDPTLADAEGVDEYFGVPVQARYFNETIRRTRRWGIFDYRDWRAIMADDPANIVQQMGGSSG